MSFTNTKYAYHVFIIFGKSKERLHGAYWNIDLATCFYDTINIILSSVNSKKINTSIFSILNNSYDLQKHENVKSRLQTKKFTIQDLTLIGLTTTVPIAAKSHQSHNVASSLMVFSILSHDLVTSESKATFNPHCGFSFNGASDFSTDTNHHLQTAVWLFLKDSNWVIWTNNHS